MSSFAWHTAPGYLHSDAGDQDSQEEGSGTHDVDWQEIGDFGGERVSFLGGDAISASALGSREIPGVIPNNEEEVSQCCNKLANWRRVYRDTSSIPSPGNFTGQLLLGFMTLEGENLDIGELTIRFPLLPTPRSDILLSTGSVQITVPNVSVGSNYIAVLFGDSGNASPQFTITGGSSTTTTLSPSPTGTTPSLPPTHPLSPIPTISPTPSSLPPTSPPPATPTNTSTPGTSTVTSPISSPSSSTPTPSSVTSTSNAPNTSPPSSSNGTTNSALPALRAHGARAITLCAAAAAMSLVLVL
ncbi:hypothetical protein EDB83DRAFT_2537336 [Lactarius deliciosus]|nr:hypothetical protein EDB83DRAFT_2537336 [Lactarius deliciosus]